MKTIVILGNGFDLDLGWKTSYSDFYKAKCKNFTNIAGMSYIKDMMVGEYWYNLEGYIRDCILSLSEDNISVINSFWQVCRDYIFDYLTNRNNEASVYTTKHEGCAYALLKELNNSSIVSFNYTDPFTKNGLEFRDILYIHGSLREGAYKIKIGVDSSVKSECKFSDEEYVRCIIKTNENNEKLETFLSELKRAKNIIIYGHSLGITDSDYFKPFFKGIVENRINDKKVYIVTYDESSLQSIKNNMRSYGIDYSELLLSSNVSIKTIFTSRGKDDKDFHAMIDNTLI